MLKRLDRNITIANLIAFTVAILVGGTSLFLAKNILHNAYKIEQESRNIIFVDSIHTDSYQLVLDLHHFLLKHDSVSLQGAVTLLSRIKEKIEEYKAVEAAEKYEEKNDEIERLDKMARDVQGLGIIKDVFNRVTKTGILSEEDMKLLENSEIFAYEIESLTKEINQVHAKKIKQWIGESLSGMWGVTVIYTAVILFGLPLIYITHRLLKRHITSPIKELAYATARFSEGHFEDRVHTDSQTEIGLLYQSFNKMAERLQEHDELLRKFNEELERKVKERTLELHLTNEQLQKTQNALIRAEKIAAVGQIATSVAHEIKNPLNSLSINTQILLRGIKVKCGPEECPFFESSNLMQYEIRRINNILDSFVSYAKFPEPKFMPNDINQIVREVAAFISSAANEGGISVELSLPDTGPVFLFDRPQIKQVLMNLCQNAIPAMPQGGILKTAITSSDNNVIIIVSDTGIGIPEKNLGRIFTPFFSTNEGGLGLGLPIVQKIIEGHGGRISLRSKVGEGTVFEIVLPVDRG